MCPVHSCIVNRGGAGASGLQKRRKRRCINVIPGTPGYPACVCRTYARIHMYARDFCIEVSRHASRRSPSSPGETTSRLSNCRSCIMHRSLQVSLVLLLRSHSPDCTRSPISPASTLSFYLLLSTPVYSRRSPENKVPEFRRRSCGSAGISCGGEILYQISERGGCQRERTAGGIKERTGETRKCSDHTSAIRTTANTCARAGMHARAFYDEKRIRFRSKWWLDI